ncbi:MAG TPA: YqeG family HAD IIIA-type phosphatase [Ruminococcaceae bacterium]|nr:YqeG family HAD IIIA-type phosphatase [Oscillospiraceae bacterium]
MSLFLPDLIKKNITEITAGELREKGIGGLLLDVDNTLAIHGSQEPFEGVDRWLSDMRVAGIKLMILSNARKKRVAPFAKTISLPFRSFSVKPFPWSYLRACRKIGLRRRETAIVGDQIITDTIGGNLCGIYTVLVMPPREETSFTGKLKRGFEKWLLKRNDLYWE